MNEYIKWGIPIVITLIIVIVIVVYFSSGGSSGSDDDEPDSGSTFSGCTKQSAVNYDSTAVNDDGSCQCGEGSTLATQGTNLGHCVCDVGHVGEGLRAVAGRCAVDMSGTNIVSLTSTTTGTITG